MGDTIKTAIWDQVKKTDPSATKTSNQGGRQQTSIDGYWMIGRATEIFGPVGIGWGYEVLEERLDDGAPALVSAGEGNPPLVITTKTHTIKLRFWYKHEGEVGEVVQYGHTPALYRSKHGVSDDGEAPKKSLMDAIKKSLSMLGFCADVFTGQFDDREYVETRRTEEDIEKATDKDKEIADKRAELTKYVTDHLAVIEKASSASEVAGVEKVCVIALTRNQKIAPLADIAARGIDAIVKASKTRMIQLKEKANG